MKRKIGLFPPERGTTTRIRRLIKGAAQQTPPLGTLRRQARSGRVRPWSGRGDPQQYTVFSALFTQAFNGHEDPVFDPEFGRENCVEFRGHISTGFDLGCSVNDRSALFHPAHAITDPHFHPGTVMEPLYFAAHRGRGHNQIITVPGNPDRCGHRVPGLAERRQRDKALIAQGGEGAGEARAASISMRCSNPWHSGDPAERCTQADTLQGGDSIGFRSLEFLYG